MTAPVILLILGIAAMFAGCKATENDISPELLQELVQKHGELTTITTVTGVLGIAIVILGAALGIALYKYSRGKR